MQLYVFRTDLLSIIIIIIIIIILSPDTVFTAIGIRLLADTQHN